MQCPRRAENHGPWLYDTEDQWEKRNGVNHCSYCGSMDPVEVLRLMHQGCALGPTDKNYKVYVQHETISSKFYFQHFDKAQEIEFINIVNGEYPDEPRFRIDYPGYFYVLPYFCKPKKGGNDDITG